jgi:hypothetical protein
MSPVRTLDVEKLRGRRIIAAATLAAVTVAFLLLRGRSAPVSATPPAAGPSYQAADTQVPSDPAEAEQTPPAQTPMELEPLALFLNPDDPPADQMSAPGMPRGEWPAPLTDVPHDSTSPSAQRSFKARRAIETIDAREFLRRAK